METDSGRGLLGGGGAEPRPPQSASAPKQPTAGLVVGGCRLDSVLGRGGMGTVYLATQLALNRQVAVKLVPAEAPDAAMVARFKREVRTAAALEHPNSVPIYAAGEEDGLLYLVMRLVHGPDLGALVAREGPLAADRAVDLVTQIAGALDAAHAAGLVHRDVKPANVLVEAHGAGERAYLSDFGLMRQASGGTAITRVGEWVGSVDYVAPEQLEGQSVDGRADVYALTGLLYTLLSGQPPFQRDTPTGKAWAHVNAERPRLPGRGVPERMNAVIARGMAQRPEDRYGSAGELARAARAALRPEAGAGGRGGRPPRSQTDARAVWRRQARARIVAAVLLTCLAGAVAAGVALHSASSGTPATGQPTGRQQLALSDYRFSYPAGWRVLEREHPLGQGTFFRTEVVSPDGTQAVIIDRSPGAQVSPLIAARRVQAATAARTAGYQPVALYPTTLGGRPAAVWQFTISTEIPGARVDVFENLGPNGYAVLGEGAQLTQMTPIDLAVARSLQAP